MIISASRRTDIPACYADWFFNRLKEGFVLVRNPMRPRQVSRITLNPEVVDGIVFWTKNPIPMLDRLRMLEPYPCYFHFTLTPYGPDVEKLLPPKDSALIPAFQELSEELGPERVIWRYDPIFINDIYTPEYHIRRFREMAEALSPFTRKCVISFLDFYRNTEKNFAAHPILPLTPALQDFIAQNLAEIARRCHLQLSMCAEDRDFTRYGIRQARCADEQIFCDMTGRPLKAPKDRNQRPQCGCAESVDIGAYNTCRNRCLYCYANYSDKLAARNILDHDPLSPLLSGHIGPEDHITERRMRSLAAEAPARAAGYSPVSREEQPD